MKRLSNHLNIVITSSANMLQGLDNFFFLIVEQYFNLIPCN